MINPEILPLRGPDFFIMGDGGSIVTVRAVKPGKGNNPVFVEDIESVLEDSPVRPNGTITLAIGEERESRLNGIVRVSEGKTVRVEVAGQNAITITNVGGREDYVAYHVDGWRQGRRHHLGRVIPSGDYDGISHEVPADGPVTAHKFPSGVRVWIRKPLR